MNDVVKVANYPNGYTFENTFVESSYVLFNGQKRFISGSAEGDMCYILKEDGIYIFCPASAFLNCPSVAILRKY